MVSPRVHGVSYLSRFHSVDTTELLSRLEYRSNFKLTVPTSCIAPTGLPFFHDARVLTDRSLEVFIYRSTL